jgi:hypothetical protein
MPMNTPINSTKKLLTEAERVMSAPESDGFELDSRVQVPTKAFVMPAEFDTADSVAVFRNGVLLKPYSDYTKTEPCSITPKRMAKPGDIFRFCKPASATKAPRTRKTQLPLPLPMANDDYLHLSAKLDALAEEAYRHGFSQENFASLARDSFDRVFCARGHDSYTNRGTVIPPARALPARTLNADGSPKKGSQLHKELTELLVAHRIIDAIKLHREVAQCGLREAKHHVDTLLDKLRKAGIAQ